MFPSLVPGRVGCDAGRAHRQHSKQDQIDIAGTMVLTGLVVCQCYRDSVYVQHSTQGYSDPKFLGYIDHMPKVLETKLKRKARKMKLGEKSRRLRLWRTLQDRLKAEEEKVLDAWPGCEEPTITIQWPQSIHHSRVGPNCRSFRRPGPLETTDTYGSSILGTGQLPWQGRGKGALPTIWRPGFSRTSGIERCR